MNNKPEFFIVGAAKSGTTALQQMLATHPAIYMSPIKEPNYFYNEVAISDLRSGLQNKLKNENAEQWIKDGMKGVLWNAFLRDEELYKKLFENAMENQFCGEASVSYLYSTQAAKNIFEYNPNAKIIILLRNPTERAWSHFQMETKMKITTGNFYHEFNKNKSLAQPIWGRDPIFLSGGKYYEQLKRFLEVFPKEQILILLYEDYKNDAATTINTILKFIGVNLDTESFDVKNKIANEARKSIVDDILPSGSLKSSLRKIAQSLGLHSLLKNVFSKKNQGRIPNEVEVLLNEYYLDDITNLEKLLQINLSNWKQQ